MPQAVGRKKLYQEVAGKISAQIEQGTLAPGEKIPSLRIFKRQFGVSMSTVLGAYGILEDQGLLQSKPKSGFYVASHLRVPEIGPPPFEKPSRLKMITLYPKLYEVFTTLGRELTRADSPILYLGFPDFDMDLVPAGILKECWTAGFERLGRKGFEYNAPPGDENLRRQLAHHYLGRGLHLSPNDLMLTTSCSESIMLALAAITKEGDTVAVPAPETQWSFGLQAVKRKVLEIPVDPQTGMDLDYLEEALGRQKVKACAMVTFGDPIGCLMPEANKKRLVEMLAKRRIPLIEDDVFGDVYLGDKRPRPAKAFDTRGLVLLCSSFSKSLAPGLRVGWLTPGKFFNDVRAFKMVAAMGGCRFNESAMGKFMEKGEYDKHLTKFREFLTSNLRAFNAALSRYFPEGTRVSRPAGGVSLWVEFPGKFDSMRLHREALKENIFILPGFTFSTEGRFHNYTRLCFCHPWSDRVEKALKTLGQLAKKQTEKQGFFKKRPTN